MTDIISNQFKMSGASFVGIDKDGNPFQISAKTGYQEYDNPDIVFLETVSGTITRKSQGTSITDNITAKTGQYNKVKRTITLNGNVHVKSSNGDRVKTNELVIKL